MEAEAIVLAIMLVVGTILILVHVDSNYAPPSNETRKGWMPREYINQRHMRSHGDVSGNILLNAIHTAILDHQRRFLIPGNPETIRVKIMGAGNQSGVDYEGCRYVTQNPLHRTPEGARVRAGATLVWIIKTRDRNGHPLIRGVVLGKIENGEIWMR